MVTKDTRVCSDHFEPDCFERDLKGELLGLKATRTLKPDALPTLSIGQERSLDCRLKTVCMTEQSKR